MGLVLDLVLPRHCGRASEASVYRDHEHRSGYGNGDDHGYRLSLALGRNDGSFSPLACARGIECKAPMRSRLPRPRASIRSAIARTPDSPPRSPKSRSEEHTSELQSRRDLVCRLLLEKK